MNGNSGLTAADVLSLTKDGNGFGGVGGFILLFIFLIALMGGFGWGNNGTSTITNALGQSDLQNDLYFQSQDAAIRSLSNGQATLTEQVMSSNYDNALLLKDLSNQLSNSVAGMTNLVQTQTNSILGAINQQTIDSLRDKLATTRDSLSNQVQTQAITNSMADQTNQILNSLGRYRTFPPCYDNCGCGSNLY